MTEVSSQIQAPAALPPAEVVKLFEGTVHGMNFSLWIPLRIHAVRNSSYYPERVLQLHNFKIRSHISGFGGLEVACWPLVPKFAGSNPV